MIWLSEAFLEASLELMIDLQSALDCAYQMQPSSIHIQGMYVLALPK
jgi:hypothetical protein